MEEMYKFEKQKLLSVLPEDVCKSLCENRAMIAGGAITSVFCNREIADIDVYFRSYREMANFLYSLEGTSNIIISYTDKAVLIKTDDDQIIQVISLATFDDPLSVFAKFDFSVVMGAYDFYAENFLFNNNFFKDNSQRVLRFHSGTLFPIMSLLRVEKYRNKGYTISKSEFLRIVLTCMNSRTRTYKELRSQVGGMYGIDMERAIIGEDDDEVDYDKIVSDLSTLYLDENYFNNIPENHRVKIGNYDEFVHTITGQKRKLFKFEKTLYKLLGNGSLSVMYPDDSSVELYEIVNFENMVDKTKLYKRVMKKDGRYFSYHDRSFEYVLGEVVVPEEWSSSKHSDGMLYFVYSTGVKDCQWSMNTDSVLIECELLSYADITGNADSISGTITVKKAKFIREVSPEEAFKLSNISIRDDRNDVPF